MSALKKKKKCVVNRQNSFFSMKISENHSQTVKAGYLTTSGGSSRFVAYPLKVHLY